MHCTSYVPVYYHPRNLNVGESDLTWNSFNCDANNGEERRTDILLPPFNMDQYLGYEKKVLRQIIQNHEATFKYQVQQLHQLYRRQRELMDEIRGKEIFTKCLQLQASESNYCLSQAWSDNSQTTSPLTSWFLGDRSDSKLSALNPKSLQGAPFFVADNFEVPTTTCPGPSLTEKVFNEVKALSSRSKGPEIRHLDLQLPADESCDEDEREQFEGGNVSKAPSLDSETTPVKTGDLSTFNLRCRNANFLIDLNEPIHIESVTSSSGPFEPYACHMELMHNDPCLSGEAEPDSEVQKQCELVNHDGSSVGTSSSEGIDLNSMPLSYLSETAITLENLASTYTESKVEYPEEHLLSLGAKSHCSSWVLCSSKNEIPPASGIKTLTLAYSSQEKNSENVDQTTVVVPSSVHDRAMDKGKCVEDISVVDTRINDELLRIKTHIDLNTGVTVDKSLTSLSSTNVGVKSAIETELEAPVSPENKEGSPPRGKSEDIVLETWPLMSEREEQEPFIELDEIAAETLVLISSSGAQEFNSSYSLYWFAEIVSSIGYGNDLGNEIMKLHNSATDNDQGNLLLVGNDDLKAKTLRLSQKKTINCSRNIKKENRRGTLSGRSGRGRTSKDLHPIKSFNKTGSVKNNTGRKVCTKLKKSSKFSPSHVKKSMGSIMKEPTTCSNQGVLLGWGKIKKRQEGYRRQASKFLVIS